MKGDSSLAEEMLEFTRRAYNRLVMWEAMLARTIPHAHRAALKAEVASADKEWLDAVASLVELRKHQAEVRAEQKRKRARARPKR